MGRSRTRACSRSNTVEQCYACDAVATSREHVPAQAFYPKPSELGEFEKRKNYRIGLITVPSCDLHNNAKSKDHNYTLGMVIFLSGLFIEAGTPGIAVPPFFQSWSERVKHGVRLRHTLESAQPIAVLGADGQPLGGTLTLEARTIDKTVEMAARGLYFHHTGHQRRWPDVCIVRNMRTVMSDLRTPPEDEGFFKMEEMLAELERRGDKRAARRGPHPDVFFYQLIEPRVGVIGMRLVFYQFFRFIAIGRSERSGNSKVEGEEGDQH